MNRRSLIFCLSALLAFAVMIVTAVFFLYREDETVSYVAAESSIVDAVPSNAVAVCVLNQARNLNHPLLSYFKVTGALADLFESGQMGTMADAPMVLSLHYAGRLVPLYVFDAGPASSKPSSDVDALISFFHGQGLQASFVDCSTLSGNGKLSGRSLVIAGETSSMITSSVNNIRQSLSIMDVEGFAEAMDLAAGKDAMIVSYSQAKPLFTSIFSREYYKDRYGELHGRKYSEAAEFFVSIADWTVLDMTGAKSSQLNISGRHVLNDDGSDFLGALGAPSPSISSVSSVLPSYTSFALSIPMADRGAYLSGYKSFLESKQQKASYEHRQTELKKKEDISPSAFVEKLGISEMAMACFGTSSTVHRVNLAKISKADTLLLRGTGLKSFPSEPMLMDYRFQSYLCSVFGNCFDLQDESCFTYINGWLITGSSAAVQEYVSGMALEYNLKQYMSDAGKEDFMAKRICSMVVYLNAAGNNALLSKILTKEARSIYDALVSGAEYAPSVMSVYKKDGEIHSDIDICHLEMQRSRASEYERDTTVTVPSGPFKIINSGTGRTNLFYQQSNGAIGLKEEDGKGLWAVPFKQKICGTAHNVDYYANGNKQILFGAGSEIYLIDRLGRYVNGFPVDLGKEILIGPDVYDFNGVHAYNIMVLHKDNTVQMYNLKGKVPDSWQGIAPKHTIKKLPERITVGGNTFWVVRTSIQTLIYPFVGGEPLTLFEGDRQILPTSRITVKDASSVEVECYDGVTRTVKLK